MRYRIHVAVVVVAVCGYAACSSSPGSSDGDEGDPTSNKEKIEQFCDKYCACDGACEAAEDDDDGVALGVGDKDGCVEEFTEYLEGLTSCQADAVADLLACLGKEGSCEVDEGGAGGGGGGSGVFLVDDDCTSDFDDALDDCRGDDGAGGSGVAVSAVANGPGAGPGPGPGPVTGPSVSSGGGDCGGTIFQDPAVQACNEASCCTELAACAQDPSSCFDAEGTLDPSLASGEALYQCAYFASCFGPQAAVCNSGIAFGSEADPADPAQIEFAYCLDQSCCEEMTDCTSGGTEAGTAACIDCLNGDLATFELCQDASDCSRANCDGSLIFSEYCDSGIGTSAGDVGICGGAECCALWNECSGGTDDAGMPLDQDRADECIACLNGDGAGICADVNACMDENCSTAVCDSGVSYSSLAQAECLTASCCAAFNTCTDDGADVDACIECFESEAGGPLCDGAIECFDANCSDGG